MYEKYWNLKEKPFNNTPDPRFLYFARQYEEALTRMLYTITENKGAMALTGECGCGKTLLSRILITHLDEARFDLAVVPHPSLGPRDFLAEILSQFGCPAHPTADKGELLRLLRDWLQENRRQGKRTILVVDEAQMVKDLTTLEEIRLLLNFQLDREFLLTLLLIGQPELAAALDQLPQLKQRMAVSYHLERLSEAESREYVRHRLHVAGAEHELFTREAEDILAAAGGGVPRKLNNLADMALLVGYGQKAPLIDQAIMARVEEDQREKA